METRVMSSDESSQSPANLPEMDPGIWSRLPEFLLEHVLSFLPLKTFLSLRSTSKHLNSLIFSPSFISTHSSPSSSLSFLLLSHSQFHHYFPLYDTTLNIWRTKPLSLSPLQSSTPSTPYLLSISHGLLCFAVQYSSSFLVYNLLSRSSRTVEFPEYPFAFELLTLVSTHNGYKLFMLGSSSGLPNKAFVYDSGLHLWSQFDRVDSVQGSNSLHEVVSYNGYLYFTTPEPFSIVCFDLESGKWEKSMSTELPSELVFVRLASDGDEKLYLIAGVGENGIARKMKLWELSRGRSWVEIGSVPEMMCRKFMSICYHNYEHVYGFWHQGLICLCCVNWPEILYYKVSKGTWHWLPKCPCLPEKWSCGFRWFSLVPELHASV